MIIWSYRVQWILIVIDFGLILLNKLLFWYLLLRNFYFLFHLLHGYFLFHKLLWFFLLNWLFLFLDLGEVEFNAVVGTLVIVPFVVVLLVEDKAHRLDGLLKVMLPFEVNVDGFEVGFARILLKPGMTSTPAQLRLLRKEFIGRHLPLLDRAPADAPVQVQLINLVQVLRDEMHLVHSLRHFLLRILHKLPLLIVVLQRAKHIYLQIVINLLELIYYLLLSRMSSTSTTISNFEVCMIRMLEYFWDQDFYAFRTVILMSLY